jgi:sarcosine oxidase subunit alpha
MSGQKLIVPMENKNINVTVSDSVFLDKENKRINA